MKDVTYHLTSDGVLIDCDEYFQTLEPQTSVMMVLKEQKDYIKTGMERYCHIVERIDLYY